MRLFPAYEVSQTN